MPNRIRPDCVPSFETTGFHVFRQVFSQSLCREAVAEYENTYACASEDMFDDCDDPVLVYWMHRPGGRKRYMKLSDAPAIRRLVTHEFVLEQIATIFKTPVRLLETIVFNKPPAVGGQLMWHHDMSYYPLRDGRLVSAWIPFDQVTPENGAVSYAAGSHLHGDMGAVDLATGRPLAGEDRPIVPNDPASLNYRIETPTLDLGDFVLMDGRVWHGSGPNHSAGKQRRGLAIRYFSEDMRYHPRPGNAATFVRQIRSRPGDPIEGGAFPMLAS